MRVALVGGTGAFGRSLAARWNESGVEVLIGSRDASRAQELAAVIGVSGGANEEVVREADFVVLAVQSSAAVDTARGLAAAIDSTPVLCVASDLRFTKSEVLPARNEGSLAEDIAVLLAAPVVSGFQSLPAAHLARPGPVDQDVLVCGDDEEAKRTALDLGERLVSGRAIDAGPLMNARALEGMTAVILNVNQRYGAHAGIRLTGLP